MNNKINVALREFDRVLKDYFGSKYNRLILFGSVAKDLADETSDIDVMVVMNMPVDDVNWQLEREVRDFAFCVELECDVVFDIHLVASVELDADHSHTPFIDAVLSEGVTI